MAQDKRNLTRALIESLPPADAGKRYFVFDAKERGLAIRVTDKAVKGFYLYRWSKDAGKPIQLKLGPWPDMTVEQARERAHEANNQLANDVDPAAARKEARKASTFGEAFAWWVESHAKARRKSWREDQDVFRRYLGPIVTVKLSQLSKAELRRLHADLGASVGKRTANKAIELVRAILNAAIRHEQFNGPNPALAVEMFELQSRDRRLMPGEMAAFFQALGEESNPDIRDYVILSLLTGARQMNVLGMRWADIDRVARIWTIPGAAAKGGRPVVVPLEDGELELLDRRRVEHGAGVWVFPGRAGSKYGHLIEPKSGWNRILRRANEIRAAANEPPLADLRIHDLRRTLGSNMADVGASLPIIGRALGHQSQAATAIYARLTLDPVRAAKRAAHAAILGAQREGEPSC